VRRQAQEVAIDYHDRPYYGTYLYPHLVHLREDKVASR
jgi:hypothetical protein